MNKLKNLKVIIDQKSKNDIFYLKKSLQNHIIYLILLMIKKF